MSTEPFALKKRGRPQKSEEEKRLKRNLTQNKYRLQQKNNQSSIESKWIERIQKYLQRDEPEQCHQDWPISQVDKCEIELKEVYDGPMLAYVITHWNELVRRGFIVSDANYQESFKRNILSKLNTLDWPKVTRQITYSQTQEYLFGRYFARNCGKSSLQGMCRFLRHILCRKYLIDIDVKSCHPSFYLHLCRQANLPTKAMEHWNNYRSQITEECLQQHKQLVDLDADSIKTQVLSFLNGGSYSKFTVANSNEQTTIQHEAINNVFNEIRGNVKLLVEYLNKHVSTKYHDVIIKKSDRHRNTDFRTLALYYSDQENKVLNIMYNVAIQHKFSVAALVFDGMMIEVSDKMMVEYQAYRSCLNSPTPCPQWLASLLTECKSVVNLELGLDLVFEDKPMTQPENLKFDISTTQFYTNSISSTHHIFNNSMFWQKFQACDNGSVVIAPKLVSLLKDQYYFVDENWMSFNPDTRLWHVDESDYMVNEISSLMLHHARNALQYYHKLLKHVSLKLKDDIHNEELQDEFEKLEQKMKVWNDRLSAKNPATSWVEASIWKRVIALLKPALGCDPNLVQYLNKCKDLDDPMQFMIPVQDGLCFDLQSDKLIPRTHHHLFTDEICVSYIPWSEVADDDKKEWLEFMLNICTPYEFCHYTDDGTIIRDVPQVEQIYINDVVDLFQKLLGASLTASTRDEFAVMLQGAGGNGKSKLLKIVSDLMGSKMCKQSAGGILFDGVKKDDQTNIYTACQDSRFLHLTEVPQSGKFLADNFKRIVSGESIEGRNCYSTKNNSARPKCKVWISCNDATMPQGIINDNAFERRLIVIYMPNKFESSFSVQAEASLKRFMKGGSFQYVVLSWIIEGARRWFKEGIDKDNLPWKVSQATQSYLQIADHKMSFLNSEFVAIEGKFMLCSTVRDTYEKFCERNGHQPLPPKQFISTLLKTPWCLDHKITLRDNYRFELNGKTCRTNVLFGLVLKNHADIILNE